VTGAGRVRALVVGPSALLGREPVEAQGRLVVVAGALDDADTLGGQLLGHRGDRGGVLARVAQELGGVLEPVPVLGGDHQGPR
jgi:hypothetical protein